MKTTRSKADKHPADMSLLEYTHHELGSFIMALFGALGIFFLILVADLLGTLSALLFS